jgi:hypothetical protein
VNRVLSTIIESLLLGVWVGLLAGCGAGTVEAPDDGGQDAADGGEDAADGGEDAADGGEDAADGSEDAADGGEDAADGGEDAADGSEDAADGGEDAADGGEDAADGGEDAADGGLDGGDLGPAYGAEFWVAPWGLDVHPGTREEPFASLERARQAVRELRASGLPEDGVVVWLRGGLYLREATLNLGAEDSGEEVRPVVWRSAPGEEARLAGARRLESDWFRPVAEADAAWARLDPAARGQVLVAELAAHGFTDYGELQVRGFAPDRPAALELFLDGQPLSLARWPDPDEHVPDPTFHDPELVLHGDPQPDVTGRYTALGTSDGVNAYRRDGLVDGRQYNLYRHTWDYQGRTYTAWFLSTQTSGYPGNADPWWYLYAHELGGMSPSTGAGAAGRPTPFDPAAIRHGFVSIARVDSDTRFAYLGDRPARWGAAEEPWLHGYWKYMWADLHVRPLSIDPVGRTIDLRERPGYGLEVGQPFYAENLLEEITRPGEWYLDRTSGRLYLWPPRPLEGAELLASVLAAPLVRLQNAAWLQLEGLVLEATRQNLVWIEGGHDNRLLGCELRNAGNNGAIISGVRNGLERGRVRDTGDRGASLSGGSRAGLARAENYVRNTRIERFGRWAWTYRPAVALSGCGHVVEHNHLFDAPHSAVLFTGNEHRIEWNDIHDVCRFSSDAGAVYTGRDWGYRGSRVAWNHIHDLRTFFQGYGVHAVYLDDCVSGVEVFGNLLHRVQYLGVLLGGGRDNLIHNNLMVECGQAALAADNRGPTAINNTPGDSWNLLERLAADGIQYQAEPWASAYPLLALIPNSWAAISAPDALWMYPEGNVFSRNLGFRNRAFAVAGDWVGGGVFEHFADRSDNLEDADPLFVDEAGGDLRLRPESPAYTIPGFQPIPFERIGIQPE